MPTFRHGDVAIAYLDEGESDPIVLVHGFASNKEVNWVMPGWTATLRRDGRRVIALDNRGHGQSAKLYDPADYHTDIMAGDVAALIEHLKLGRADLMSYSLGSRISAVLAARHPEMVRSVILGGAGIRLIDNAGLRDEIAESLEMPALADVTDPLSRLGLRLALGLGLCHVFLPQLEARIASAPLTISMSSVVIPAWRTLFA